MHAVQEQWKKSQFFVTLIYYECIPVCDLCLYVLVCLFVIWYFGPAVASAYSQHLFLGAGTSFLSSDFDQVQESEE